MIYQSIHFEIMIQFHYK